MVYRTSWIGVLALTGSDSVRGSPSPAKEVRRTLTVCGRPVGAVMLRVRISGMAGADVVTAIVSVPELYLVGQQQ